ncbi:MAG: response regulator [Chloroflexi bacterium]|nr:response regulator [Chloroflexota bacterium]
MNREENLERQLRQLEDRVSKLSQAVIRISESPDLNEVLERVLEGARDLTGADYSLITTEDDSKGLDDFMVSGITPDEAGRLWNTPGGMAMKKHLDAIQHPHRVDDFPAYAQSMGFQDFSMPVPVTAFLSVALKHQGRNLGKLHIANNRPGELFNRQDEETLVMFASQAAPVLENAQRFKEERKAKTYFETLIETSSVGVVVLDLKNGDPYLMNQEARRLADILKAPDDTPESLAGNLRIRRSDGREYSLRDFPLASILTENEIIRAEEITLEGPNGNSVNALVNSSLIVSPVGEAESLVVTLQDMTPLEEIELLRAEFLGMVSHELRTPLTSIEGAAMVMMGSSSELVPTEWRQYLKIIVDQAENMRSLIGDLLDVARIETGTLPVNLAPVKVAALVDQARIDFANSGGQNALDIDIAPHLPLVMADGQRIVQVIGNLISNAARNSPSDSVIKLSVSNDGVHVTVSIADAGRGIPAENLPHLFRKFYRNDADERSQDTGLGLAICKGIVEAHGGRIWAESEGSGLGARFTFTLVGVEESSGDGDAPELLEESADQVRVLVVDDDPQTILFVRRIINDAGYHASVTAAPEEVLPMLETEKPDLVLLDLMLPGVEGIDLLDDILDTADIPVIFLSAYGRDHIIARAFKKGATDYIVKPFSPTELVARIDAALRKQRLVDQYELHERFVLGELEINYAERLVTFRGEPVKLTATEYLLLKELSLSAGRVLTYQQIMRRVWKTRDTDDIRSLRTHIARLRSKMGEDASDKTYILTEPRVGYRMAKGKIVQQLTA